MARKFLYFIAFCIVLVIAAGFALSLWPTALTRLTMTPSVKFEPQPALAPSIYDNPDMWFARPGKTGEAPALWTPAGFVPDGPPIDVAVFFIHPTSYLKRDHWNAPIDDPQAKELGLIVTRANASVFGRAAEVWAPRYRQATFGAFVTDKHEARQALDLAYSDVAQAFDRFVAAQPAGRAIVIAGHSQGSFLAKRLLREKVAGTPLARRIAAVYAIGWVVDTARDLPAMGLPACASADQSGCVISYLSFADEADTSQMREAYERLAGASGTGKPEYLCSNPLSGKEGGTVSAGGNLGGIVPTKAMDGGRITPNLVGASCAPDGSLRIGPGPKMGPFVLPGGNYHVYDYALYWTNLRQDFARRTLAWRKTR